MNSNDLSINDPRENDFVNSKFLFVEVFLDFLVLEIAGVAIYAPPPSPDEVGWEAHPGAV